MNYYYQRLGLLQAVLAYMGHGKIESAFERWSYASPENDIEDN